MLCNNIAWHSQNICGTGKLTNGIDRHGRLLTLKPLKLSQEQCNGIDVWCLNLVITMNLILHCTYKTNSCINSLAQDATHVVNVAKIHVQISRMLRIWYSLLLIIILRMVSKVMIWCFFGIEIWGMSSLECAEFPKYKCTQNFEGKVKYSLFIMLLLYVKSLYVCMYWTRILITIAQWCKWQGIP